MATTESTQLRDISSLTFAAKTKMQTTLKAISLQLELPDLEQALPTVRGLLETMNYYAETLANDIDVACEDHATEPV
jgi:hypothetical protein